MATQQQFMRLISLLLALMTHDASGSDVLPRRGSLGLPVAPVSVEQATTLKLKPGVGVVAIQPVAGLTADRAGIKSGDIVVALNGKPVGPSSILATVRELPAGRPLSITVVRNGKSTELETTLMEKPRDPGNANYDVVYGHVVSHGKRMRTIVTRPTKPGKYPGFLFIQGFSPISYDFTLEGSTGDVATLDGPILFEFANSGFVTLRVEKPGVGDSEGGPFAEMDYTTELDIYRQSLKQLKETKEVDFGNVFIFGHSMGGAFGPMIAAENPVKGLVVYGVASRTWFEYLLDTLRYQGLVAGDTFEKADDLVRQGSQLLALVFLENQSVDEVKKSHPKLAGLADSLFPGGLFNGKALVFWRQLVETNFAAYWATCNAHVLAVRGASDFVTYDADHKLIADIVNRAHPGWGKSAVLPGSDHIFHNFATESESLKNFKTGKFNPAFIKMTKDWIDAVMASRD
ncbi:MAG: alpha/beta fold hydrolase [Isosphaeraceae bacterium]